MKAILIYNVVCFLNWTETRWQIKPFLDLHRFDL